MSIFRKGYAVKVKFVMNNDDATRVVQVYTIKARSDRDAKNAVERHVRDGFNCTVTDVAAFGCDGRPHQVHTT